MSQLRIHRYILREIAPPTVLSLLIFSFVLLLGRIPRVTEMVISQGVPAGDMIQLFGYLLPTFFSITFPLAFLLGILLAFGRLSSESEFVALKASGIGLYALFKPVLLLAVLFVLLTGWVTIVVEPASKAAFRGKLYQLASSHLGVNIEAGVFNDQVDGIVLYARGRDPQQGVLQNLFISDERAGATPATITAEQGRIISDKSRQRHTLRLFNGQIHRQPLEQSTYQVIDFSTYDINLSLEDAQDAQRRRKHSELSWSELNQSLDNAKTDSTRFSLLAEKHERIVIAFAPLVLMLVGVPLGLQSQRSGKGAGFALALVVFLVYYILYSVAATLADGGTLPAAIILWLPNVFFLLGGGYFVYCTANEKPLTVLTLLPRLWRRLIRRKAPPEEP